MNVFGLSGRSKSMREARSTKPPTAHVGGSAAATPPGDVEASMSSRTDRLQERLASHDRELLRLRGELRSTKADTRQHKFYAKRAAQVLSQKKSLEKRLAAAMNMRYNLTVAQDEAAATAALASLQPRRSEADALRSGNAMLREMDHPEPEDVDEVIEDMREMVREVEEVGQMLGRDDLFDDAGVDDAELEEELMREMEGMPSADNVDDVGGEDYMKRIDDLMPTPHHANPQPYRPPPKAKGAQGKQPRQQRPTRRGGN